MLAILHAYFGVAIDLCQSSGTLIWWVFNDKEVFKCRAAQRESQISEKHSSSCFVEWKYKKLSIQQPRFVIDFYSVVSYSYRIDVDIQARLWSVPLHHSIAAVIESLQLRIDHVVTMSIRLLSRIDPDSVPESGSKR